MYLELVSFLYAIFLSVSAKSLRHVTCGSVVKLINSNYNVRLHSHDVKYGSGSGQQSVTAVKDADDNNSYWQVLAKTGGNCKRGKPIKCGSTVRFLHINTKTHLHSHNFHSPLSNNIEVSAYDGSDEEDDVEADGDNWQVECDSEAWERDDEVRLKHVATGSYLHINGEKFGRPISGQYEASQKNQWLVMEGVYISLGHSEFGGTTGHDEEHDEL